MDTFLSIVVPLGTLLLGAGGVVGWQRLRRIDEPVSRAQIDKLRAETRKTEVDTLMAALEAVGAERSQAYQRITDLSVTVTQQGKEIADVRTEIAKQVEAFQARLQEVRDLLAEHGQWDRRAHTLLLTIDPHFPEPPPLAI